jgi:hypothetical protein
MYGGDSPFGASGFVGSSSGAFPSPFDDLSSMAIPTEPRNALKWCERIWNWNGTYQQAHKRIIAYFMTDYDIRAFNKQDSISSEDKDKWESCLVDQLHLPLVEYQMNVDRACYGNAFASIHVPFKRLLTCSNCGMVSPFERVGYNRASKLRYSSGEFHAGCAKCGHHGLHYHEDKLENNADALSVKIWPVHEIYLKHDIYSGDTEYWWRIPDDYIQKVRRNDVFTLARANMKVLKAIDNQKLFKFKPGALYHMKEPVVSGIKNRGWGISRIISSFKQIYYVQVLYRHNEVIAHDYVVPFRVITPAPRNGANEEASDPFYGANLGGFTNYIDSMVKRRRRDPASHFSLPFPIEYQVLGGEANQLAPHEMLRAGVDDMLDATGIPAEMFRGTMRLEHVPLASRMFESTWQHMVHDNNSLIHWAVMRLSQILSWDPADVKHKRVTVADDLQKQLALLQLAAQGEVSRTTAYQPLGTNYREERRRQMEEQLEDMRLQAEMEHELENRAFMDDIARGNVMLNAPPGGAAPMEGDPTGAVQPGGGPIAGTQAPAMDPAAGGGAQPPMMPGMGTGSLVQMFAPQGVPEDMESMQQLAAQMAEHLLYAVPESMRYTNLHSLKQENELLHTLVRKMMDEIRAEVRREGGMQAEEQIKQQIAQGG